MDWGQWKIIFADGRRERAWVVAWESDVAASNGPYSLLHPLEDFHLTVKKNPTCRYEPVISLSPPQFIEKSRFDVTNPRPQMTNKSGIHRDKNHSLCGVTGNGGGGGGGESVLLCFLLSLMLRCEITSKRRNPERPQLTRLVISFFFFFHLQLITFRQNIANFKASLPFRASCKSNWCFFWFSRGKLRTYCSVSKHAHTHIHTQTDDGYINNQKCKTALHARPVIKIVCMNE